MIDGIGTSTYAYKPIPAAAASPATTTDWAGRFLSVDGPWASDTITYGYDPSGRSLTRQIDGANNISSFTYNYINQTSRLENVQNPNGTSTILAYFNNAGDQRLRQIKHLVTIPGTVISQFDTTHAATGRIDTWTQNHSGLSAAKRSDFGYDPVDQLTSASQSTVGTGTSLSEKAYRYDRAGNRTTAQDGSTLTSYTANNLNQLTTSGGGGKMRFAGTVSEPATVTVGGNPANVSANNNYEGYANVTAGQSNTVSIVATDKEGNVTAKTVNVAPAAVPAKVFAYDDNGNLLANGPSATQGTSEISYTYDAANRLTSITQGANIYGYEYDGQSRRVKIKLNGVEQKRILWDGLEQVEERSSSGTPDSVNKRYYPQGFQTVSAIQPFSLSAFYYTRDHLGSIRELTDTTGIVRARYDYDPYGVRTNNLITVNPIESDFGYTGHYYETATGLHMAPYRFYDVKLGRWLSRDPIGEMGGINLSGYVANDPINLIDPDGLFWREFGEELTRGATAFGGGAESYFSDLGVGAYEMSALNGLFGPEAQVIAEETAAAIGNALKALSECPDQVARGASEFAKRNPERIGGRAASGLLMSGGLRASFRGGISPSASAPLSGAFFGLAGHGAMSNVVNSARTYAPQNLIDAAVGGYSPY